MPVSDGDLDAIFDRHSWEISSKGTSIPYLSDGLKPASSGLQRSPWLESGLPLQDLTRMTSEHSVVTHLLNAAAGALSTTLGLFGA